MIALAFDVFVFALYLLVHFIIVLVAVYLGVFLHLLTEWMLSKLKSKDRFEPEDWPERTGGMRPAEIRTVETRTENLPR